MIPPRHLILLASLESLVMFSAVLRLVVPGLGIDFNKPFQLGWFVAVLLLASAAIAHYVLRASMLAPRRKAGEDVESELKQVLSVSLAIIGLALLISLAGPSRFERLAGEPAVQPAGTLC